MTLLVSSSITEDSESLVTQPNYVISNQKCFEAINRELNLGARNTSSLECLKRLREQLLVLMNPEKFQNVYPRLRRVIGIKRADRRRDLRNRPDGIEEENYEKNGIQIQDQLCALDTLWDRFESWFSDEAPSRKVLKKFFQVYVTVWKRIYEIENGVTLDERAVDFFRSKIKKVYDEGRSLGLAECELFSVLDSNISTRSQEVNALAHRINDQLSLYEREVLEMEDEADKRILNGVSEDDMDEVLDHMEELYYEVARGYTH